MAFKVISMGNGTLNAQSPSPVQQQAPQQEPTQLQQQYQQLQTPPQQGRIQQFVGNELNEMKENLKTFGRLGVRAAESVAGLPGSILEAGQTLGNIGAGAITGKENTFGSEVPFSISGLRKNVSEPLAEKITGQKGSLEPKDWTEKLVGSIVEDAVPFMLTGGASLGAKAAKALKLSSAGNLAALAGETIGGKGLGDVFKLGTYLGAGLLGKQGAQKTAEGLMNRKNDIPKTAWVDYAPLKKVVEKAEAWTQAGAGEKVPDKKYVADFLREIKGKLAPNGKSIKGWELPEFIGDWNAMWDKAPTVAKPWGEALKKGMDAALKTGPDIVAEAARDYEAGRGLYHAIKAEGKIAKWIAEHPNLQKYAKYLAIGGLAGGGGLSIPKTAVGAGIVGAGYAGMKVADFIHKLVKHPELAKYYKSMLKFAVEGKEAALIKVGNQFFKEMDKVEKKEDNQKRKKSPKSGSSSFRVISQP